ncbi:MAG: UDP-glucose 4-epimerase GalE [Chitinophagales bacterium]
MKKILVTGGCGYIGSHTVVDLIQQGFEVICADSFVHSNRHIPKGIEAITGKALKIYDGDLCNADVVQQLFESEQPDAVIHFAAFKSVPESVAQPLLYYQNNLNSLLNVLQQSENYGVKGVVFSSSAAVYGNTTNPLLTETTPLLPAESPYGHTKQIGEDMITAHARQSKGAFVSLRYFNPSGAHPSAQIGELPMATYNVTPRITATAIGMFEKFMVYGNDYPTRDGTCVRDYIHVMDIARAHTQALHFLQHQPTATHEVFNLGTGDGVTVMELIDAFESASKQKLNYEITGRRAGDVAILCADATKAKQQLQWLPQYSVFDMMKTAWDWQLRLRELNWR